MCLIRAGRPQKIPHPQLHGLNFKKMIQGMTLRRAEIEQLISFQLKSEFWMIFFYWHQRAELTRDGITSSSATLCG